MVLLEVALVWNSSTDAILPPVAVRTIVPTSPTTLPVLASVKETAKRTAPVPLQLARA
jgi:hypothetical protein